ncbi:MAG TPA: glycosyltransferase [Gemmataceae bacterium]|jgi:glycosyltransferase involved in cell wall biosynthesis
MAKADILVSAVAVLHDHAAVLPAFLDDLAPVLDRHYANYEIVLIDNGSADGTDAVARKLLGRHRCVRYVRLAGPTDDETALMAGLDAAIGDYVVTLHADFDPPAELVPMVEACRAGTDLVLGVDRDPPRPGPVYRALRSAFLGLARRLVGVSLVTGSTGYRALTRQAVNALVKVRLRRRYFAVIAADVGLTTAVHPYVRTSRSGTRPALGLARAVRIGLSVLVHNSIAPLRVASGLGLLGSGLSFLYFLYATTVYLFKRDVMPGWTTLSLAISGLFMPLFLILALLGEYVGRLLEESSDRPLYHVRDEQSSAVMLTDLTRRNVEIPNSKFPAPN